MPDHKHYVPILKGRRAEFPALAAITDRASITPLIEAVPKYDGKFIAKSMTKSWSGTYFVDFMHYGEAPVPSGGKKVHPIEACFDSIVGQGGFFRPKAVPVTGTGRTPEYQNAVKRIVAAQKNGVVIRLQPIDFDETDLAAALKALLGLLALKKDQADIIIDLGSIAGVEKATVAQMHKANLNLLPSINEWRSLTVAASAFPLSLAEPLIKAEVWNPVARNDWLSWKSLVTGKDRPDRLPAYSDYGISHPGVPPTKRATTLAQLRYATPNTWLIWKGHDVNKHAKGYNQFNDICRKMIQLPECKPPTFSEGDRMIHAKAAIDDSPGIPETWRRIGLNHHIEMVISQIANLP